MKEPITAYVKRVWQRGCFSQPSRPFSATRTPAIRRGPALVSGTHWLKRPTCLHQAESPHSNRGTMACVMSHRLGDHVKQCFRCQTLRMNEECSDKVHQSVDSEIESTGERSLTCMGIVLPQFRNRSRFQGLTMDHWHDKQAPNQLPQC